MTSQTGAALQDILQILRRRDPSLQVVIYPTAVQGKEASAEIVQMIELANRRQEVDVLIVGRGGGSLEDLWCFNEEMVARAIFHSQLPIISAVGHETDVTIADFVADLRAPTPSAAAELVSRDQQALLQQLVYQRQRLEMELDRLFKQKDDRLQRLRLRLHNQHPQRQLSAQKQLMQQLAHRLDWSMQAVLQQKQAQLRVLWARVEKNPLPFTLQKQKQDLEQLKVRLDVALKRELTFKQHQFVALCTKLDSISPLKVFARGYSIAQNAQGVAITQLKQVSVGEPVITRLADGEIVSQVTELRPRS